MIGVLIAAWLDVRSRPFRTFAAIMGMVVAVVAVVVVNAANVLSHKANDEYIARQFGLPATLSIGAIEGKASSAQSAAFFRMLTASGVANVSVDVETFPQVAIRGKLNGIQARWVSSSYPQIKVVDLLAGSWPVATASSDTLHVVVSSEFAGQLGFSDANAVGQAIVYSTEGEGGSRDIRTASLRTMVIDAVAKSASTGFSDSSFLIVSDLDHPEFVRTGSVRWSARINSSDLGFVQDIVRRGDGDPSSPTYEVRRVDLSSQLAPVLNQQRVTARAVTLVALLVGGLGILAVGLASVRERRRDFGLRRALGASKPIVFSGVLVQSLLEAMIAAVLAVPLAAMAVTWFARELVLAELPLPSNIALPASSVAIGLVGALIAGAIAGLMPATSAARASVVQALKG